MVPEHPKYKIENEYLMTREKALAYATSEMGRPYDLSSFLSEMREKAVGVRCS